MIRTKRSDPAEHLESDADVVAYLTAALEDGDARLVAAAPGDVARARGMTGIARDTGLAREALYRALSEGGNPSFDTVLRVAKSLGVRFVATPADTKAPRKPAREKRVHPSPRIRSAE